MKTTKSTREFNPTLPGWSKLSPQQKKVLQSKIDDFPGQINAQLVWSLVKDCLDELAEK